MAQMAQFKLFGSVRVRPVRGWRRFFVHRDRRRFSGQIGRIYYVEIGRASMLPLYTVIFGEHKERIQGGVFFEDEIESPG